MSKKLDFSPGVAEQGPRIGGVALIGGLKEWPATPEGVPLTLVMSLPTQFLAEHAAFTLPANHYISVFTYYASDAYFLDCITYHGTQDELDTIRKGYTQVILHGEGAALAGAITIPATAISVDLLSEGMDNFQQSKMGGEADLLQNATLELGRERFALQLYSRDFPEPYKDIFFLSEALAYLFIDEQGATGVPPLEAGTFFVQVT